MNKSLVIKIISFILFTIILTTNSWSQAIDSLRHEDKLRIREAFKIAEKFGDQLWSGWSNVPFAILIVTDKNEYLINLDNPSEDFHLLEFDSITQKNIYVRPRQFGNNMLATFPAVNGISTIAVGLPENTDLSSMQWIITLLHEHFHQLQYSKPDYQNAVKELDLAGGDESGMWMLNYKFPYDNKEVSAMYKQLTLSAKELFLEKNPEVFKTKLDKYFVDRNAFRSMLSDKDYKYFSFQLWQEGIARYTEIKIAELMKDGNYLPSKEFADINDYITADSFYTEIIGKLMMRAEKQDLSQNKRECFYTLGAMEGLILDRVNPEWRDLYFKDKFFLEEYFGI